MSPEDSAAGRTGGRLLHERALWCHGFTPLAALDPPDGIVLDITGCAHLFGGEAGLVRRLGAAWPEARIAIADTAAAAWALAHFGPIAGADRRTARLEDLPLAGLRIADATIARLRRLGLRRIGEVLRLSRGEIRAGFGADLVLRLDRLRGHAPEALHFLTPPVDWRVVGFHAEPLFTAEQLQAELMRLVEALCERLVAAESGLVGVEAQYYRVDARRLTDRIGFAAPTRDRVHVARLLGERLRHIDPGFGIEAVALVGEAAALPPGQAELAGRAAPDYAPTIDRLMRRVTLYRLGPVATHIPERAMRRVQVTGSAAGWTMPDDPRPVRLFARPEPIAVLAPVPDDPPRMIRWRDVAYRIVHATGPERIGRDWWHHEPATARPETERIRDYYAVETAAGERFWVFRAGLHEGEVAPRWFIHGLF
jgi:protein ImuB